MEGKNESKHTPEDRPDFGGWVAIAQIGSPGHCNAAQIFGRDGKAIVMMEPTDDPQVATDRANLIVDAVNSAPALLEVTRELISVIKEIESNWISADHYSGSETNDRAYAAIVKANKIINGK